MITYVDIRIATQEVVVRSMQMQLQNKEPEDKVNQNKTIILLGMILNFNLSFVCLEKTNKKHSAKSVWSFEIFCLTTSK